MMVLLAFTGFDETETDDGQTPPKSPKSPFRFFKQHRTKTQGCCRRPETQVDDQTQNTATTVPFVYSRSFANSIFPPLQHFSLSVNSHGINRWAQYGRKQS